MIYSILFQGSFNFQANIFFLGHFLLFKEIHILFDQKFNTDRSLLNSDRYIEWSFFQLNSALEMKNNYEKYGEFRTKF